MRILTMFWGFGVSFLFTGELVTSVKIFLVMAAGNTAIMWYFSK